MEERTPYTTDRDRQEDATRPASQSMLASLALMKEELSRRHVIILGCQKPSQARAERDLTHYTFLLQIFPRCARCEAQA